MAFFDDFGKKLSQAGQSAVQKTKDMTEIAKINGAINEEEKKINNTYFQIGKLYATLHSSDYEADFEGMITYLKGAEQRIAQYKEQIQQIKRVTRCEKCGAEVADNSAFCSSCGAPMPKKTAPIDENMIRCPGCGQAVSKNMRFCTSCGRPLADMAPQPAPAPQPVPQPEPAPMPVPEVAPMPEVTPVPEVEMETSTATLYEQAFVEETVTRRCPQCGVEITDDSIFCTECGTRL